MSSETFWIILGVVAYALSVTAISLRKAGYTKAADIIEIILTCGAAAMMKAKELSKGKDDDQDPPGVGRGSPTEPPPALPRAPGETMGRSERSGLVMIGALGAFGVPTVSGLGIWLLVSGCGATDEVQKVVQGASSGLVVTAPLIVEGYRAVQELCLLKASGDADKAQACVNDVRARWKPVPQVYGGIHDVRCTFEPQRAECQPTAPGAPSASVAPWGAP